MTKWVYGFGGGKAEGKAEMKNLLGGKGANLAEMANLGLPVPPGFTITTEVCTHYYANGETYPTELARRGRCRRSRRSRRIAGKKFGDATNPLLVSVRSGARASMPGMMDTVLNLGLNDETVEALAKKPGDARFAYDSYRRFITMYSRCGARRRASSVRGAFWPSTRMPTAFSSIPSSTADGSKMLVSLYKSVRRGGNAASRSRRIRCEQLWGRSAPCSVPG